MTMNINQIVESIIKLSDSETHPDKVARIFSTCMSVTLKIVEEMRKIREETK